MSNEGPTLEHGRERLRALLADAVSDRLDDGDYTMTVRVRVQAGSVTAWAAPRVTRDE